MEFGFDGTLLVMLSYFQDVRRGLAGRLPGPALLPLTVGSIAAPARRCTGRWPAGSATPPDAYA